MSLAAWVTPFFTTDQKGSDAWPWVTTARWMLPRPLEVEVLVDVDPDVQASRIAARPGTAATDAPATADFLKRSRRVRSAAISHISRLFLRATMPSKKTTLRRTSVTGPLSGSGSAASMTSCSSTYQPPYPAAPRR